MIILLVRHSESSKNVARCFSDARAASTLTVRGVSQARRLSESFRRAFQTKTCNVVVLTSFEPRASDTATVIADALSAPVIKNNQLSPIDPGDVAGMPEHVAERKYPELKRQKKAYHSGRLDGFLLQYPNGESVPVFQERILSALSSHLLQNLGEIYILVGHQSTITAILSHFENIRERRRFYHYYLLHQNRVSAIETDDRMRGRILGVNLTARHLLTQIELPPAKHHSARP